jgi:hypothetical protein
MAPAGPAMAAPTAAPTAVSTILRFVFLVFIGVMFEVFRTVRNWRLPSRSEYQVSSAMRNISHVQYAADGMDRLREWFSQTFDIQKLHRDE